MVELAVQKRETSGAHALRAQGLVPAVFYGRKEASTPIAVPLKAFDKVFKEAGETTVITLTGVGDKKDVLVHAVQTDPLSGTPIHIDFYVLEKGKKIRLSIPLEFSGAAPAEKAGAVIVKTMHEIEIEVIPQELPHTLVVDLGMLTEVGSHILARDIVLPPSASLKTTPDEIVVSATAFKEEVVNATAPAVPETVILTEEKKKERDAAKAEGE
jgi:large subunit ribosomal protein L25